MSKFQFTNNQISFNKHNSSNKISKIIQALNNGDSIALVSDAGMPSICDPGEDLVKEVKSKGLNIVCIPGPCAAITALVSSGLPSSKFSFEGFLPRKKSEREQILIKISKNEETTILFESPHRLKKLLKEFKEYFGEGREIQVSRELTKKFEEHIGNNVKQVIDYFDAKEVFGEITIIIKGIEKVKKNSNINESELKRELYELINAGLTLSQASKYLAKKKNLKKNIIYNIY